MKSDVSACGASFTQKTNAEINLDALNSNGGPTQTMALQADSLAIDAGDNATCAAAPVVNRDQRGIARPQDGDSIGPSNCDIGAFERCPIEPCQLVVDADGDGYTDAVEAHIGTNAAYPCGTAGWPANLVDPVPPQVFPPNRLDIGDVTSFLAPIRRLDTSFGHVDFSFRWDLVPGTSPFPPNPDTRDINIADITELFNGPDGSGAYPPMFNGQHAWERTCPYGP
jgi:hypothetical protein